MNKSNLRRVCHDFRWFSHCRARSNKEEDNEKLRVNIVSDLTRGVLTANAKNTSKPPLGYEEVKRKLENILADAGQTTFKPCQNGSVYPATSASVIPPPHGTSAPIQHPGYSIPGVVQKKQQREEKVPPLFPE